MIVPHDGVATANLRGASCGGTDPAQRIGESDQPRGHLAAKWASKMNRTLAAPSAILGRGPPLEERTHANS